MKAQLETRITEINNHLEKIVAEYNAALGRKSEAEHILSIIKASESTGAIDSELELDHIPGVEPRDYLDVPQH